MTSVFTSRSTPLPWLLNTCSVPSYLEQPGGEARYIMILPWQLVVNIVGLCLVVCAAAPAVLSITRRLPEKHPRAVDVLYGDEDGTATEDSHNGLSVRVQKISLTVLTIAGTCVSLVTGIFATVADDRVRYARAVELWLQSALWVGYHLR